MCVDDIIITRDYSIDRDERALGKKSILWGMRYVVHLKQSIFTFQGEYAIDPFKKGSQTWV